MLSIITITFNNFEELIKTLDSISVSNSIESVVVNGGNDDSTLSYLKNYNGRVVNESDEGIADAFNKGIKNANGEYIMILNSGDTLIRDNYINEAIKIFKDNPDIAFVHSNILFDDSVGGKIIMKPTMKNMGRGLPYLHPTMIMKKSLLKEVGYFNKGYKMAMDFELVLRIQKLNMKGHYIDKAPPILMDGKGISSNKEFDAIRECIRALIENNSLTATNILGLITRLILFFSRRLLLLTGGRVVLRFLKRVKYSA